MNTPSLPSKLELAQKIRENGEPTSKAFGVLDAELRVACAIDIENAIKDHTAAQLRLASENEKLSGRLQWLSWAASVSAVISAGAATFDFWVRLFS